MLYILYIIYKIYNINIYIYISLIFYLLQLNIIFNNLFDCLCLFFSGIVHFFENFIDGVRWNMYFRSFFYCGLKEDDKVQQTLRFVNVALRTLIKYYRRTMKYTKYATFNCQGLNDDNKKSSLADDFLLHQITVMILQETRITGQGVHKITSSSGHRTFPVQFWSPIYMIGWSRFSR